MPGRSRLWEEDEGGNIFFFFFQFGFTHRTLGSWGCWNTAQGQGCLPECLWLRCWPSPSRQVTSGQWFDRPGPALLRWDSGQPISQPRHALPCTPLAGVLGDTHQNDPPQIAGARPADPGCSWRTECKSSPAVCLDPGHGHCEVCELWLLTAPGSPCTAEVPGAQWGPGVGSGALFQNRGPPP